MMTNDQVIEQSKTELDQLAGMGRSAIGVLYPHAPFELILAHGFTPTLLRTNPNVSGAYETSLQTFACSLVRNMFSQRELDQFPLVAGLIFPGNTCDSLQNLGDIWRVRFPNDKVFRLTYPVADQSDASKEFLAQELRLLSERLSKDLDYPFSEDGYRYAVRLMQDFREAAQTLYIGRLLNSKTITYSQLASLVRGFLSAPSDGMLEKIKETATRVSQELEERNLKEFGDTLREALLKRDFHGIEFPVKLPYPRIAVIGGMTDPDALTRIIESLPKTSDSIIVLDVLSFGLKTVFTRPPEGDDPFEAMAVSILTSPGEPTQEGLPDRVRFLKDIVSNLYIHGLIICEQSFCDPDEFETPSIEKAVSELNIPVVRLPLDSELSDMSRLGVRIQSFLETLGSRKEGC